MSRYHDFEGEQRTLAEIQMRVPCLALSTIRMHLAAGRNTRQLMLCYGSEQRRKAIGKKGANTFRRRFGSS